jgi:hypothetical protein
MRKNAPQGRARKNAAAFHHQQSRKAQKQGFCEWPSLCRQYWAGVKVPKAPK